MDDASDRERDSVVLPLTTRMLMVAETLDELAQAAREQLPGGELGAAIEQESEVLRDMAAEINGS